MSDSDDTDVLLLIPPDLYIIPSSDSEDSHRAGRRNYHRTGVITEILEHVQSLESRINAIESRDNSLRLSPLNASLDSHLQPISHPPVEFSPMKQFQLGHSQSRFSSPPITPAKPRHCSSVKTSPGYLPLSFGADSRRNDTTLGCRVHDDNVTDTINACAQIWKKRDNVTTCGQQSSLGSQPSDKSGFLSLLDQPQNPTESNNIAVCPSKVYKSRSERATERDIGEMQLSEVDDLLQEMEATEIELAKRINNSGAHRYGEERSRLKNVTDTVTDSSLGETKSVSKSPVRRLDFQFAHEEYQRPFGSFDFHRDRDTEHLADVSLPDEDTALRINETETTVADIKAWEKSTKNLGPIKTDGGGRNFEKNHDKFILENNGSTSNNITETIGERPINRRAMNSTPRNIPEHRSSRSFETIDSEIHVPGAESSNSRSLPNIKSPSAVHCAPNDNVKSKAIGYSNDGTNDTTKSGLQDAKQSQCTNELHQTIREIRTTGHQGASSPLAKSTVICPRKSQRLLALADFWDCDGTKSQEEMLRIKLEEEKFRREHCEHLIQELQKRLLEQQEKVAVAIRVDNEKNTAISQFQDAWSKLRERWDTLEKKHSELESTLKNLTDKHRSEVTEYQQQIKRGDGELSKALDLAAGYKEKSDSLVKEKLELFECHADELEKYKLLVQEAERRYESLKTDYNTLSERNKQLEEIGNKAQQELNKERMRSSEVRTEMGVIHKALDTCEAELTILRREKDSLELKLKDEQAKNEILERNKSAMLAAISDAKNSEISAKEETKSLVNRQEQIRSELREIYQNQLDDVVKTKLKEFQEQLDAAELAFHADLETRQRAIAECAARKIKSIIDKHQLEINLLEEKHIEEKRLGEIQLAQASQKAVMLEVQLSTQRAGKTHLAEQLHSVMQKQWQQALDIISGGQMENLSPLQRLNAERIFETKGTKRCHSACCNKDYRSTKPELGSSSTQNLRNSNSRQEQDESLVTLTSNDEAPVTRMESKDDLRKYIKMILDMQQPNKYDFVRTKYTDECNSSSSPVTREVPRKHYTKKEHNGLSEESVAWQRVDEQSVHDISEYMQIPQSQGSKADQQRSKPPWK